MNYYRRSTVGFSIAQMMLDFTGGLLSNAQLFIDSYLQDDWSGVWGNPVKFLLANLSIFFDVIFFCQHFWWYRGAREEADGQNGHVEGGDQEPLLGRS
jgi:cystinosin